MGLNKPRTSSSPTLSGRSARGTDVPYPLESGLGVDFAGGGLTTSNRYAAFSLSGAKSWGRRSVLFGDLNRMKIRAPSVDWCSPF